MEHSGANTKVVRDIVLTCVVLHNMLRTHQGGIARKPNPQDGVIVNEPIIYEADENSRNPLRDVKQQRELLKDYFNDVGILTGQVERK